ncbi:MAG: FAD:protein FMN transferase [Bdellovibrionia bacterium]
MPRHEAYVHVRHRQNHMATTFDLRISCEKSRIKAADSVLLEAHHRIEVLEGELSEFLSSSPVRQLNLAEPFMEVPVPSSVIDLLEQSLKIQERTAGAFSCTVKSGPLSRQVPKPMDWSRERGVAWRTTADAWLSFAAIGKGYALDRVRHLIERNGFTDYLLNAGGSSLVFSGFSAPGEPWSWAWSWKRDEQGQDLGIEFSHVTGEKISIGVSGLHEKGLHLIDPRTGAKAQECQTALVAHPSAGTADALSTALFVSQGEWKDPEKLLDSAVPFATASIDSSGTPRWNGWFQRFWGGLDRSAQLGLLFLITASMSTTAAWADSGDEAIDLGSLGVSKFNPYLFERHSWLVALPAFASALALIHLLRVKRARSAASKKIQTPQNVTKGTVQ